MKHVIIREPGRVLIDRQTLATLAARSVNTIRARCPVVTHKNGRALYDMEECASILDNTPIRRSAA